MIFTANRYQKYDLSSLPRAHRRIRSERVGFSGSMTQVLSSKSCITSQKTWNSSNFYATKKKKWDESTYNAYFLCIVPALSEKRCHKESRLLTFSASLTASRKLEPLVRINWFGRTVSWSNLLALSHWGTASGSTVKGTFGNAGGKHAVKMCFRPAWSQSSIWTFAMSWSMWVTRSQPTRSSCSVMCFQYETGLSELFSLALMIAS